MEKKPTELELTFTLETEALWNAFEKTGSIDAFLRYVQKAQNSKELVLVD